jgi:hypothetical protein
MKPTTGRTQCQRTMERDRVAKGRAQAAGVVLAAADSGRARRQEPAKGGAVDAAKTPDVAAKAPAEAANPKNIKGGTTMPARDGTGPMGTGPMTGRGAGSCAGGAVPGYRSFRMGCGRGFRGRGGQNMFPATGLPGWAHGSVSAAPAPAQELAILTQQAEHFNTALAGIRRRIHEIESRPAEPQTDR